MARTVKKNANENDDYVHMTSWCAEPFVGFFQSWPNLVTMALGYMCHTRVELELLLCIGMHAHGNKNYSYVSIGRIARYCRCDPRSVHRAAASLEEKGYLIRNKRAFKASTDPQAQQKRAAYWRKKGTPDPNPKNGRKRSSVWDLSPLCKAVTNLWSIGILADRGDDPFFGKGPQVPRRMLHPEVVFTSGGRVVCVTPPSETSDRPVSHRVTARSSEFCPPGQESSDRAVIHKTNENNEDTPQEDAIQRMRIGRLSPAHTSDSFAVRGVGEIPQETTNLTNLTGQDTEDQAPTAPPVLVGNTSCVDDAMRQDQYQHATQALQGAEEEEDSDMARQGSNKAAIDAVIGAARHKAKTQVSENARRAQAREQRMANLQSKGPPKVRGWAQRLWREVWEPNFRELFPEVEVPKWEVKELGMLNKLISPEKGYGYSKDVVEKGVMYLVCQWRTIHGAFFPKKSTLGVPTLGFLVKFHDQILVQAQQANLSSVTIQAQRELEAAQAALDAWDEANPYGFLSEERPRLVEAVKQAKEKLEVS